jgi:hypothetical protein
VLLLDQFFLINKSMLLIIKFLNTFCLVTKCEISYIFLMGTEKRKITKTIYLWHVHQI